MKKLRFTILIGILILFGLSLLALGYGISKYGSISGLNRRIQIEIASLRPKKPVVVPTFVPVATVDTLAFMANLATETSISIQPTVNAVTPTPTEIIAKEKVEKEKVEEVVEPVEIETIEPVFEPIPLPTSTPNPLYSPVAPFVNLTGYRHNWQTWNNCGPATLATYLSYLGKGVTQVEAAAGLKPNESDKNVRVDEIVSYVEERFPDLVATPLINGSPETLRLLLSNNFPVMLQTWLEEEPNDGMGHFRFLIGYDDSTAEWIVSDSFISTNVSSPYSGIRIENDRFSDHWQVFGNNYILIYRPEDSLLINAIVGQNLDSDINHDQAVADYAQKLQQDDQNPFVWHTMGELLMLDGRPEQAVQAYDQARTIGLPWRMFWYSFGVFEAYMAVARYQDVVDLADVTIQSGGAGEEVYYWKGVGHGAMGEKAKADAAFRQALWWNPTHQASIDALNGS